MVKTPMQRRNLNRDGSPDRNVNVFERAEDMEPENEQHENKRGILTSLGNFFLGPRVKHADPALTKMLGQVELEEFLSQEDAWLRIIDISHTLWGKSMAASAITSLIREYDEKQEIEQQL